MKKIFILTTVLFLYCNFLFAASITDESFKKHLTEKMSTNINDWKHLYTCVSTADFKNIKEKTNATSIEESEVEIEEVKK